MTAKEALEKCRHMWQWLADNPTAIKYDYFMAMHTPEVQNLCYLCEYLIASGSKQCDECLLVALWPNSCTAYGAAYDRWCDCQDAGNDAGTTAAALEIVEACNKELLKYDTNRAAN